MAAVVTMIAVTAPAQVNVEYFFDTDPGRGKAVQVTAPVDAEGNIIFEPPTSGLTPGAHLLGIRAYNVSDETTYYAPTLTQLCYVPRRGTDAQITSIEYFWDDDPGIGRGVAVAVPAGSEVNLTDIELSTAGLAPGHHMLGIRAYGNAGRGPTLCQDVFVPVSAEAARITYIEYFWDDDPGCGKGTSVAFAASNEVNITDVELSAAGLEPGVHQLGIRAYGNVGWGPTLRQEVYVPVSAEATHITYVEYFWDSDPGLGKGTRMAIAAAKEVNIEDVEISTADLECGQHEFGIRAFGSMNWGPTYRQSIYVPYDEADVKILQAEYFFDDDPGFGQGTPIQINEGQELTIDGLGLPTDGLEAGAHLLGIRYRGINGWSATFITDFLVMEDLDLVISSAEYFWNEDPGFGQATPINITPGQEVSLDDFGVPSFDVHGDAVLFVRYRGSFGWSPTVAYTIMVDAEGNYTLNASAATSLENRNYQTLVDAIGDFADRGVGDAITLTIPTTNTEYELDATGDDMLSQLEAITENISRISTPRKCKAIGFKAAANSGNTLSVTTTDEALMTVLGFFANTSLENVGLTINGTAYDFTPATLRQEECCGATTPVALSAISTAVKATWQAQPHNGTVLSGFTAEGSGDLPAMTITNSGTTMDSLAYRVTLNDADDRELCSYTYYTYVHARMANQAFTSLLPATGSSLDPVKTTLRWNAFGDATGYRLVVTETTDGAEATEIVNTETDKTSYDVTVRPGYSYTWTVTAIGHCDEITSPAMTFEGRRLPDLTVTAITLPEAAEAGNQLTVTATIANQGEGATTENQWTDRLYYVIDSENFAAAVQTAEVKHTGNLAVGNSYDVTFTMKVPYLEAGNLRVFVETDVAANVMEADDTNNRSLSTTSATLQPFYMNPADLVALRKLYSDFGGANWTGKPWNTTSELITETNWSGITFDTEGRVTAINLQGRGLRGTLDVANLETMQNLTNLNLSYNRINALTTALPETLTSVNVGYQDIETSVLFSDILDQCDNLPALLPNVVTYNAASRLFSFDGYFQLTNALDAGSQSWRMNLSDGEAQQVANPTVIYNEVSGHEVRMRVYNGNTWNDMRLVVDFTEGDVNLNGQCNVADLQHLVNFAVNDTHSRVFFNFRAADLQPDGSANVLDVVRLVNLLLADNEEDVAQIRRRVLQRLVRGEADAQLTLRGQELVLVTSRPVSAFDICLRISEGTSVQWLPDDCDLQMSLNSGTTTSHAVAYSLSGETLPVGTTVLARITDGTVAVSRAMLVDADALEVSVDFGNIATTVCSMSDSGDDPEIYSVDGIKHQGTIHRKGLYIVNGRKKLVK